MMHVTVRTTLHLVPQRQHPGIRKLPERQEMTRMDEAGMLLWPTLARA